MKKWFLAVLALSLGASAVSAQAYNTVLVSFNHLGAGERLTPNSSVFPVWNGKMIKLFRGAFYLSEIELHLADGSRVMLADRYILADAARPAQEWDLGSWPVSTIEGITVRIGVDSLHNHADPALYPANHPLAPQNPSMHWGWVSGYRFMAIEGRVDNNADGVPEAAMEFHNIGNDLYTEVYIPGQRSAENGVLHLRLDVEYARLFENMTLSQNLINHGNFVMNQLLAANAAAEDFLSLPLATAIQDAPAPEAIVTVAPNPVTHQAAITYALAGAPANWELVNEAGQVVRRSGNLPAEGILALKREGLPAGLYYSIFRIDGRRVSVTPVVLAE